MAEYRKKLIEVALPLEAINRESAREKSIRHGHPSTLHLWWARRPLAACRAVLFASIVDDPSSRPEEFATEEDQERERQRLFRIIEGLVKWENSDNQTVLDQARAEITRSTDGNPPLVLDPFCGGGSIPLEAQRLGLGAHASDLNPVAVLITKALIEIPPNFAGRAPSNPEARRKLDHSGGWRAAEGLADDVRYYGRWMCSEARKRIGHLYPRENLPDGKSATVVAWLWVRTVASPNPVLAGTHVPLTSSFVLTAKGRQQAYVEPVVRGTEYEFVVRDGTPPDPEAAKRGTRAGKAQDFVCLLTGTPITRAYVREEGKAGRLGSRLMAVVAEGERRKLFLSPGTSAESSELSYEELQRVEEARSTFLAGELPNRAMVTGGVCSAYGLSTWGELFTDRQIVALTTFADLVGEARSAVISDGGEESYADAVVTYLALSVGKASNIWSSLTGWMGDRGALRETFARQALPMVWDYAEANPFSSSGGSIEMILERIVDVVAALPAKTQMSVRQLDATALPVDAGLVSTDPPYYDNISYSELSDYFYVWLRRAVGDRYPDLFSTLLTPKAEELVAAPHRVSGGRRAAAEFFESGLRKAFARMHTAQEATYPLALFYAFKQAESEGDSDGVASTGWDTMLAGLLEAGFMITGTWPMRTEGAGRVVAQGKNALASSVVLVCRPRPADAPLSTRREFVNALRAELPNALRELQHGNIAPVDLAQAAIGPGMGVFTRYARVLESDGRSMPVRGALALINQALDEILAAQEGDFDPDTRFAVTWFEQRGGAEGPYGEADVLARAKDTSVDGMVEAGVIASRAGKVRLLRSDEMQGDWNPALDRRPTAWEAVQHLTRRLSDEGEEGAADLLRRLGGGYGEQARELAYRLYSICERKGWAQEALPYNALVVAWPEIARRVAGTPEAEAQQTLEV